jgi:histidinol dehydrogenase
VAVRLSQSEADFEERLTALLDVRRESAPDVEAAARAIVEDVRARGDAALIAYTARFDGIELTADRLAVTADELAAAERAVSEEQRQALTLARDRIAAYHARQMPRDDRYTDKAGVVLGTRWTAIESVGLYVPGGTAAYPSSVLMNAVPARVAGVERVVMTVPMPPGVTSPLVLAAARLAGVDEVYRVGGAQAIAALAYGTATIRPVAKIVGPGRDYVAAAKRIVFGTVGIDMIAGPSEVLVVADADNDPDWIAADLLAQAEHDATAQAILVTNSEALADAVDVAVERQLTALPRSEIAAASWRDHGAVIVVGSLAAAMDVANRFAPEHIELAVAAPEALLARLRNAGAAFLGRFTPEAIGDYVGGPNHVLPTARSARFSSGLSVFDFLKRTSILGLGAGELAALAGPAITLAEAEGLGAHARSLSIRLNRREGR